MGGGGRAISMLIVRVGGAAGGGGRRTDHGTVGFGGLFGGLDLAAEEVIVLAGSSSSVLL